MIEENDTAMDYRIIAWNFAAFQRCRLEFLQVLRNGEKVSQRKYNVLAVHQVYCAKEDLKAMPFCI